jgi:hypothetical protein
MRAFVASLHRLYQAQKITLDTLQGLRDAGKISEEEYDLITNS